MGNNSIKTKIKKKILIYILYSRNHNKTYVGQTDDIASRLNYHNSGRVKSTKRYTPWEKIYHEIYESRKEAMKRERYFKSRSGRKMISKILNDWKNKNSKIVF
jgi:putative endonuclease